MHRGGVGGEVVSMRIHGKFNATYHVRLHGQWLRWSDHDGCGVRRVLARPQPATVPTEDRNMVTTAAATSQNVRPAPDLKALKARQRQAWSAGDYAVVGTTLQIVGEELCEALDVHSGQK